MTVFFNSCVCAFEVSLCYTFLCTANKDLSMMWVGFTAVINCGCGSSKKRTWKKSFQWSPRHRWLTSFTCRSLRQTPLLSLWSRLYTADTGENQTEATDAVHVKSYVSALIESEWKSFIFNWGMLFLIYMSQCLSFQSLLRTSWWKIFLSSKVDLRSI